MQGCKEILITKYMQSYQNRIKNVKIGRIDLIKKSKIILWLSLHPCKYAFNKRRALEYILKIRVVNKINSGKKGK